MGALLMGMMNRRLLLSILSSSFLLLLYFALVTRPQPGSSQNPSKVSATPTVVILQYHHIANDTPNATSTSIALFKQQLALLKQLHFSVLPLSTIIENLNQELPLPERVVALTFDDAYSNFYDNALPLLRKYGYPATVFVATTHISDESREFLSWSQLKELNQYDIEIGSHSHTHNYLARDLQLKNTHQQRNKIETDIKHSLNLIKLHLSVETQLFAYPYGEYSINLIDLISEMGLVGFGQHSGPIGENSNFSALPRFPASNDFGSIESLRVKLLTKPFSKFNTAPTEPFSKINPPTLRLEFSDRTLKVNCFATSQGLIPLTTMIENSTLVVVATAAQPLTEGRSRYNCTAAADEPYFYWFSQPWVIIK